MVMKVGCESKTLELMLLNPMLSPEADGWPWQLKVYKVVFRLMFKSTEFYIVILANVYVGERTLYRK